MLNGNSGFGGKSGYRLDRPNRSIAEIAESRRQDEEIRQVTSPTARGDTRRDSLNFCPWPGLSNIHHENYV